MTAEQGTLLIELLQQVVYLLQWVAAAALGSLLYKIGRG